MAMFLFRDLADELDSMRPSRLLDQHFGEGLGPEDLLAPLTWPTFPTLRRSHYMRPWRLNSTDAGSTVQCDGDGFKVNLDVQQFSPEELKVKVVDDSVVVEGKHEEKQDEHGFISRQFVRRYVLPKGYATENIQSSLSSDGVLSITAPKCDAIQDKARTIPITHTGPHKAVQEQKTEQKPEPQNNKN